MAYEHHYVNQKILEVFSDQDIPVSEKAVLIKNAHPNVTRVIIGSWSNGNAVVFARYNDGNASRVELKLVSEDVVEDATWNNNLWTSPAGDVFLRAPADDL